MPPDVLKTAQSALSEDSDDGGDVKKKPTKVAKQATDAVQKLPKGASLSGDDTEDAELAPTTAVANKGRGGRRMIPVHQSRIEDRPKPAEEEKSSLRIKIELDLEVEVELYARVKGDVTIGLL